jgi:hypothetical protein
MRTTYLAKEFSFPCAYISVKEAVVENKDYLILAADGSLNKARPPVFRGYIWGIKFCTQK